MIKISELEKLKEKLGNITKEQIDFEYYKRNIKEFINELVKIEDKDKPGTVIDFKLWPAQEEILDLIIAEQFTIFGKTRQLGLTWEALSYVLNILIFNEGKSASAISEGERDCKELCRRMDFILRHLPNWLITEKGDQDKFKENKTGIIYESNVMNIEIIHPRGENSLFKGFPSNPSAARSFTDNIVLMDEWAYHPRAEEIWTAAYPIINRPGGGGKVIGISTGEMGTFFEEVWNNADWEFKGESGNGSNLFKGMFIPWDAHPHRDREWYEQTKRNMPNTYKSQYPATPAEMFTTGSGAFFPKFDREIHIPFGKDWYPPMGWRIIGAYDGGYNRACFKWYAISNDGWIVCYREYYPYQTIDPIQAEDIRMLSRDPDGVPEQFDYIVADTSCWAKNQESGKSTIEIMEEHGIRPWRQADKERIQGWRRMHEFLEPIKDEQGKIITDRFGNSLAKLRYTESCSNTIRLFPGMKCNPQKPDDLDGGQEDHVFDCDRYLCMSRPKARQTGDKRKQRQRRKRKTKPRSKAVGY